MSQPLWVKLVFERQNSRVRMWFSHRGWTPQSNYWQQSELWPRVTTEHVPTSSAASRWAPPGFHTTAGGTLLPPQSVPKADSPAPPVGHNPNAWANTNTHTHTLTYPPAKWPNSFKELFMWKVYPLLHHSPGNWTCSSRPDLCSPQTSPQPAGSPRLGSSPDASSYSRSLTGGPPASSGGAANANRSKSI